MNTENIEKKQKVIPSNAEELNPYKRVLTAEDAEGNAQPVDFRRVQHGHGPCACCGPYSE